MGMFDSTSGPKGLRVPLTRQSKPERPPALSSQDNQLAATREGDRVWRP